MVWFLRLEVTMLFLCTLGIMAALSPVAAQGSFPRLENIAAYKSVNVALGEATCGFPERSTFCQAARTQDDLLTCSQQFCIQECPYRSSAPHHTDLIDWLMDACLTAESQDLRPGSDTGSVSFLFRNHSACLALRSAPKLGPAGSFTIAVWLKLEDVFVMNVFEKRSLDRLVFLLIVSETDVQFHYGVQSGDTFSITINAAGRFRKGQWTHVALQVHGTNMSLFLNGQEEDGTAFDTRILQGPVADITSDARAWIGQNSTGSNRFIGKMQDFRFYPQTLTNREIEEVYSARIPPLHAQPACRCPSTHPRVHPVVERYCIPNGAADTTGNRVLRLDPHAHPLHYINDNDLGTAWVSSVFLNSNRLDHGVSISIDLENGQYQVFYVILHFRSPQPEAVRIQRKTSSTSDWRDWQYLAKNCSWFGMEDNGPLVSPDSVNCIRFPSDIPYTNANITFSMLTPEPNLRPGYNEFYHVATLQEFVKATHVRIQLQGQYHTGAPHVPSRHRYYAVDEITISGRCECHGHASSCVTATKPYRCACLPESHTHGANCERCEPLFNDKPFRAGNRVRAYNCRPCQCHGHASSCHYDASVDPHPQEHFRGGGGVCNNCTHNTTGRSCERCRSLFYREVGTSLWAEDSCKPCECNNDGTVNGSLECDQIVGQCKCKRHVSGRQCNQCQQGFYKLQASSAEGCLDCNCSTAGTLWPHANCHQESGRCQCKTNVIGRTCDGCNYGFKFLNRTDPDGCEPCACNPDGSLHQFCNPFTGQCECKSGIQGLLCNTCPPGTYGPRPGGVCLNCNCSATGMVPGSACHPVTGQCACQPHVDGRQCDSCRDGWYTQGLEGCQPCLCEPRGTVGGSGSCDKESGQCPCKSGVEGPRCNRCSARMYNLSLGNDTHACQSCNCDPVGTLAETGCDPDSGQCVCVPNHQAPDCSTCKPGYFRSDKRHGPCEACDCHPVGGVGQVCDADTGQCVCSNSSLAGRKCDHCQDLYFGFNPIMGRCEPCGCNPAGSVNGACHGETGQCLCKLFVTGEKCELCVEGASHMDPTNHLGCSKEPRQQPPPTGTALNASTIALSWNAPDSPNSNYLTYTLLRNLELIHTSSSRFPFGMKHFTDTSLSAYTLYTYQLVTSNIHGNTSSPDVTLRTLSSSPDVSELQLSVVGLANPTSISLNWTEPGNASGPVEHYALLSVEQNGKEKLHYRGLGTEFTVEALHPFSHYTFILQACTSGGCARSANVSVVTAQVPPQQQPAPRVRTLSPTQLQVDWEPPGMPNGIMIRYELFMRVLDESLGNTNNPSTGHRVFLSTGWLDPLQPSDSVGESMLSPPESSVVVSDLEPFTAYCFRVLAVNMAGSTTSEWSTARTAEGVPKYMSPPQVSPVSSSLLRVSWETPREQDVRGVVTAYQVSLYQEQTSDTHTPPVLTQLLYDASADERSYTATGLKSYTEYSFTVTVCNSQGCVSSLPASGRTQPSAPAGSRAPRLKPLNATTMEITWGVPTEPNGPPPVYHVERTDVSFSDADGPVIRGRRFTGTDYFVFPSTTLPVNTDFTGVQLSFRTRMDEGLILCALSPGEQEEFVALQMRNGRPFFLFDPQASAMVISPQDDEGRRYDDNRWHKLIATRRQALGTIIVDDKYHGSASATSGSTVIGQSTGIFFGGLPENFTIRRQDAGLVRTGFAGCVRDVLIQRSSSPEAVWEPLDWGTAVEEHGTYGDWEGCPAASEHGAHFVGHGFLKLDPEVFAGGVDFEISFEFRTDQLNSLLLFAYNVNGKDFILAELQGGILSWVLRWGDERVELAVWAGLSYCDGGWNSVTLLKRGALTRAALNQASEQRRSDRGGRLNISSPLYLGGVPAGLEHPALHQHSLLHGFGGCIRAVLLAASGPVLNLVKASCAAVRVNLDGCLSADTSVNCRGNDSILVYTGHKLGTLDLTPQPFTEYLYRVIAAGEGGWTAGPWQRGRSRETAPQSVLPPSRVAGVNGSSAEVSWEEPTEVRGVIERYVVKAYSRDGPSSPPISSTFGAQRLMGTLSGLSPYSSYNVTLTACTQAGCGESRRATSLTTPQEAPEEVLPPGERSYSLDSLSVYWAPPRRPNGIITHYTLYKDHAAIYQGNDTAFNISGLGVYTPHALLLSACTEAGCANSSEVTLYTGQLPPSHMEPPGLTVLDAYSINVRWSCPLEVNGQLQFYTLYQAIPSEEPVVVYNSSDLFEEYTLQNLVPGSIYLFQIAACTAGGCTTSAPSMARTDESSPEEVPPPSVTYISPYAINLTWGPPLKPNGVISSYGIWMDGLLRQNSSLTSFGVVGLSPWSLHSFRVQACTAQGCALGPLTQVWTTEMPPVGSVLLEVLPESPTSVWVKWEAPANPNGNLTYSVLFAGTFYQPSEKNSSEAEKPIAETRALLTAYTAGGWVSVRGLLAFSNYSIRVRACNGQGCVESASTSISLPPAAPDGLLPPRLAAATSTSLQVAWLNPSRPNAPGMLRYQLQMKNPATQHSLQLVDNETETVFSYVVEDLEPYTEYQFRLLVSNHYGEASSSWVTFRTGQDRPESIDPPVLYEIHPRNATISWSPPSRPNGILTHYNIYQNGYLITTAHANITSLTLSSLAPYRQYFIQVEACTEIGCTLSTHSRTLHTPAAPPEGVPSPRLYSDTPTSVLVSWAPPLHPNGPLEGYKLERRVFGSQQISTAATMMPNQTFTYLDSSASLSPWSTYEYRVIASTRQGGSNSSQWEKVTTRPSRPAGMQPPRVLVLGPESIQVTWSDPLMPNGKIERYEIRMPDPRISHTDTAALNRTIAGLQPYTNYSVTVLACSGGSGFVGGCTESLPTPAITLPTVPQGLPALSVVAVSESFLAVSWRPPASPNGPNVWYKLLRRKTQQPLASRPPKDSNRWFHVYAGDKLFHQDKGLSRYTRYDYQLLVYNDVGYASGEVVSGVTLAGPPLHPANVSAQTINHTAILLNWTTPTLQDLQGKVDLYFLTVNSSQRSQTLQLDPSVTSALISDLQPDSEYTLSLTVSNGAHNITSPEVTCTTGDGEPEGVFPPEIVILNSTAVRVLWAAPLVPNGAVTHYSVYLDGQLYTSTDGTSGSLELGGLQPFTVYDVQVEVCTVYACVKSNSTKLTTVEDMPADIAAPTIRLLGSRSVRLEWSSPGRPNGILGGYDIRRRALKPCEELQAVHSSSECSYLQCPINQKFCGNSCYTPVEQVCCGKTIHSFKASHQCCNECYLPAGNDSVSVCCGGKLHVLRPQHQCCGDYYIPIRSGELCCPDPSNLRVSVGVGDSCCQSKPFSSTAGQICCNGALHDGYGWQCCGGKLVSKESTCCGNSRKGTARAPLPGMACCGNQYINSSTTLCCGGPGQEPRAHVLENRTTLLKCCRTELIKQDEECCNGIRFDPDVAVCADRAPHDLIITEKCRPATLCPASAASKAYCGVCDFNPDQFVCTRASGKPDTAPVSIVSTSSLTQSPQPSEPAHTRLCPTAEELVYSGEPKRYYFTDTNLEPYTTYEYEVSAWNRQGRGFSLPSWVTTKEDVPRGVLPPRWSRIGIRNDVILLNWSSPITPNGEITHYVVLRDGRERYRGAERSFTDAGGIRPFHEYTYLLRACTAAGCTDSPKVVAATVQGVPEGVASPAVSTLGPRSLRISWEAPSNPNGVVREYHLNQTGVGLIHTHMQGEMEHTVKGLQPYSNYSFVLTACTVAGCGASKPSMGRTLQDAPEGVWAVPRHVVVNSTAVELYWSQPSRPNGRLAHYRLLRNGEGVFTGGPHESQHTDAELQPNTRYVYELEASTDVGSRVSSQYIIQTPVSSPEKIPAPSNVSVLGPRSVFVAWSLPGVFNSSLPLDYSVLLNAGTERPLSRSAGPHQLLLLDGLDPYTTYHIRVRACQADGCGVGEGISVRTSEAVPKVLDPPELSAAGPEVIKVRWSPPRKPNGLITAYFIYRRPRGTLEELLVFIWSEGPLEFIDASDVLKPFTEYEYRVTAHNTQGSISSSWSSILTVETEPEGMDTPRAWPTSAYSVSLNWTQPSNPNGLISKYKVLYKQQLKDPTLNSSSVTALTVPGDVHQAHVFGFEPYTTYSVCVEAVNKAGSVYSPWATIQTLQASPSGLANLNVEKREHGRALLLYWPKPASPNGVIKTYNIYSDENLEFSGLSLQFLFRRLEPFTTYALVLEACTEAGCTRTVPQLVTTEEAPPSSQLPPSAQHIGTNHVELYWVQPGQANGRILQYQVLAVKSDEDETVQAQVVCIERNVQASSFSCNVSGLKPWSKYKFQVQVSNTAGSTDSPWLTIQTNQAHPSGLAAPTVRYPEGHPNELFINWTPPLEANGVLLSYRIQRDDISFHLSFDSSVLNYTDSDLTAYTNYSYAVIACTVAGCVTSQSTTVRTLEAAPAIVEPPIVSNVTPHTLNASWTVPSIQNGEIVEYILQINDEGVYQGKKLSIQVSDLQPHTPYALIITACTNGGCKASLPTSTFTKEAPPTSMPAPNLKVTGPESVEASWKVPDHPNGVITGYELRRDGYLIYTGMDTRYQDFMLLPSIEYSYTVTANNSQGTVTSPAAVAHTQASVPSGVAPPHLQTLGPLSVLVQWDPPARANGVIISYSLYTRDATEPNMKRVIFAPHHSAFQSRSFSLTALKPYHRYEVRVEACTLLGCAASDWSSIQTHEVPPAGQSAPLLELQSDSKGMQNIFLLSWSPPAQANGKLLHYELYRRLAEETGSRPTLIYRNVSTSCHDYNLLPYTAYEYQVWAVNSAGRTGSPWTMGRTGPAPPEGVSPPTFLHVRATSAVVDIRPPAKPNGVVTIYRVFNQKKESHLLLSEGTSRQQTLHDLMPFTTYSVRVEACTCVLCCSRGPVREFRTQASAPSQQAPPQLVTLTSRSALLEWHEPLQPNGIIESCELLVRRACPQPPQPVPVACSVGPVETRFLGKGLRLNVTALLPYTTYEVCVLSYNNMGSTASSWVSITTLKEAPEYKEPFVVQSNLTLVLVDWSGSFSLNGPLRDYVLTESNLRLYSGFHSFVSLPRTSDKTFAFQVTCTTDSGSASSPVLKYSTASGLDTTEPTSGGKTGLYASGYRFYTELWFILLMAFVGLLLVAVFSGLLLRRALKNSSFVREGAPLQPLQRRSSKYPPSDSYLGPCSDLCSNHASTALLQSDGGMFDNVPDSASSVTLKGFTMHTEGLTDTKLGLTNRGFQSTISMLRVPSQSQPSHAYSQNSLHRSVSQLIDIQDRKSLAGFTWDTKLQGTDSGTYTGDEEFADSLKSFSSVKKEHATFTDTHL